VKFIPDIFIRKTIQVKNFESIDDAVLFLVDLINKCADALQEQYKILEEAHHKTICTDRLIIEMLCNKLETYGTNISYDELFKGANVHVDKNWEKIKGKIMETREACDKEIEDFLKGI
jgi:GTP1/Obg family GTP-binding protein